MRVSRRQLAVVLLYLAASLSPLYAAFVSQRVGGYPRIDLDSALFQHGGWYMTQGGVLYKDIFDVKPPLPFETTALFSLISFNDPLALHILCVIASMLAAVGILLLVEHFAYQQAHSGLASVGAAAFLLVFPAFRDAPAYGFAVKHFCLFFGLLSVWLHQRGCPFWAGVCAAMSAGYWQMGLLFCLLLLPNKRAVAGGLLAATLIVLPIVLQGAGKEMIEQAVLSHLLIEENLTLRARVIKLVPMFAFHWLLLPLALQGLFHSPRWVMVGVIWFGVQVFAFDFDGEGDLLAPLCLLAIGYGAARPRWSVGVAGFMVAASLAMPGAATGASVTLASGPNRNGLPSMGYIYWEQVIPETCHYRLSQLERQWIAEFGSEC